LNILLDYCWLHPLEEDSNKRYWYKDEEKKEKKKSFLGMNRKTPYRQTTKKGKKTCSGQSAGSVIAEEGHFTLSVILTTV